MIGPETVLAALTLHLEHVLVVGAGLFSIGLYLALSKRNAIGILMGVELMLNAVNVTLLAFARFVESPRPLDGQVFATFVITIAAAEAAVALALAVAIYRHRETVNIDEIDVLRW
jgi:NADH:ubiquinone oxidoreductase subunit K